MSDKEDAAFAQKAHTFRTSVEVRLQPLLIDCKKIDDFDPIQHGCSDE